MVVCFKRFVSATVNMKSNVYVHTKVRQSNMVYFSAVFCQPHLIIALTAASYGLFTFYYQLTVRCKPSALICQCKKRKRRRQRKTTCSFKFEVSKQTIKTIEKRYRLGKVRGRKSKCERKIKSLSAHISLFHSRVDFQYFKKCITICIG